MHEKLFTRIKRGVNEFLDTPMLQDPAREPETKPVGYSEALSRVEAIMGRSRILTLLRSADHEDMELDRLTRVVRDVVNNYSAPTTEQPSQSPRNPGIR